MSKSIPYDHIFNICELLSISRLICFESAISKLNALLQSVTIFISVLGLILSTINLLFGEQWCN